MGSKYVGANKGSKPAKASGSMKSGMKSGAGKKMC